MGKIKKLISSKSLSYFVFIGQFYVLGNYYRMGPDPHHDGYVYAAAVAVLNGNFPNRDVFAQYGPLVPELQGLWLKMFGPELLNLRIQAAIVSLSLSISIWYFARNFISENKSLLLATAWILAIPSVLPWPTLFTTLIVIVSLRVIIDLKKRAITNSRLRILISSIILGIGVFGRIHLLFIIIAVALFFALKKNLTLLHLKYWLYGSLGSITTTLLILESVDSLRAYINQCIVWPFFRYAQADMTASYIVNSFFYPVIASTCMCIFILIYNIRKKVSSSVVLYLIIVGLFVAIFMLTQLNRDGYLSLRNPKVLTIDFSRNMMHSLNFLAAFSTFLAGVILLRCFKKVSNFSSLVTVYAVSTLLQLYPLYDVNHLWMIAPILIICGLVTFAEYRFFQSVINPSLSFFLVGLISALLLQTYSFFNTERVGFESSSLKGMLSPAIHATQLDKTMRSLEIILKPKSTDFDCVNGIYAASGGNYLSSSPQFVNWGPGNGNKVVFTNRQGIFQKPIQGKSLFICNISDKNINNYIELGYKIRFKVAVTLFSESIQQDYWNVLLVQ